MLPGFILWVTIVNASDLTLNDIDACCDSSRMLRMSAVASDLEFRPNATAIDRNLRAPPMHLHNFRHAHQDFWLGWINLINSHTVSNVIVNDNMDTITCVKD